MVVVQMVDVSWVFTPCSVAAEEPKKMTVI